TQSIGPGDSMKHRAHPFLHLCGFVLFVCAFCLPPSAASSVVDANSGSTDKPKPAASEKKPEAKDDKKEPPLPLKPGRKVEFTTDEGTWLSLDVSPDGKTIIFDLIGDLYTVPISGGETKKLTSGLAFNNQPSYSPDGKKIAYISDAG